MKRYGLILADNGSNWYFTGTADASLDRHPGEPAQADPRAAAFQAVNESCLKVSAGSGRAYRHPDQPSSPPAAAESVERPRRGGPAHDLAGEIRDRSTRFPRSERNAHNPRYVMLSRSSATSGGAPGRLPGPRCHRPAPRPRGCGRCQRALSCGYLMTMTPHPASFRAMIPMVIWTARSGVAGAVGRQRAEQCPERRGEARGDQDPAGRLPHRIRQRSAGLPDRWRVGHRRRLGRAPGRAGSAGSRTGARHRPGTGSRRTPRRVTGSLQDLVGGRQPVELGLRGRFRVPVGVQELGPTPVGLVDREARGVPVHARARRRSRLPPTPGCAAGRRIRPLRRRSQSAPRATARSSTSRSPGG